MVVVRVSVSQVGLGHLGEIKNSANGPGSLGVFAKEVLGSWDKHPAMREHVGNIPWTKRGPGGDQQTEEAGRGWKYIMD